MFSVAVVLFFFFKFLLFIYLLCLFLAVLGLRFCARAFSEVHHSLSFCPVISETHSEPELLAQLVLAVLGSWLGGFRD